MRFGARLEEQKTELAKVGLKSEVFVDYALLKELALAEPSDEAQPLEPEPGTPPGTVEQEQSFEEPHKVVNVLVQPMSPSFFEEWDLQLVKIQKSLAGLLADNSAQNPKVVTSMLQCVELNREGLRKIAKKYDKNHPRECKSELERLKMFDVSMAPLITKIEGKATSSEEGRAWKARVCQSLLVMASALVLAIFLVVFKASRIQVTFVLGLLAGFMTAWGNAANDICNSVGTAVGCGAFSLVQAVVWGALFEVIGCLTMGPFVSKSIVKGIIDANDYRDTPDMYAFGMCCVLFGAGSTTLLATFYGYPISATHGIIGGLIAVGVAANGTESIGWSRVGFTVIGWAAAPLVGALVSMFIYWLIQVSVYKSGDPMKRSGRMQPVFLWFCVTINVLFVFIKGPKALKIKPLWKALLFAIIIGVVLIPIMYGVAKLYASLKKKMQAQQSTSSRWDEKRRAFGEATGRVTKKITKTFGLDDETESTTPMEISNADAADADGLAEETPERLESDAAKVAAEKNFIPLLIVSALSVACAHGGNDVGNAVGPLSAIIMVADSGEVSSKPDIPFWALCYGATGFVLGIFTMGRLTIKTVGTKITVLSPSKSFATQMGGAIAVLGSSALGLPVSTSHCLVGSVVGIGICDKIMGTGELNLKVLKKIVLAWGVTIPLASFVAFMCFMPFKHIFE